MTAPTATSRRAATVTPVALILLAVGAIAVAALMFTNLTWEQPAESVTDVVEVRRGGFDVTVPASGELAASRQIEIKNQLEGRAVITEIVAEGAFVHAGDVLVRFNDEEIRNELKDADESVISARNDLASAEAELKIINKTRESEIEKAVLAVEIAELDLEGWERGEVVSMRQDLALAVETAELNYNRLLERFDASKRLYEQEFISLDEFKQDEIALVEARARLDQAKLDIEVYENFENIKQRKQKESDLEQARKEHSRVIDRQEATVARAESDLFSRQRHLESRLERLKNHQAQLEQCTVRAPSDGLVVYASSLEGGRWMRESGNGLQVGTELWRNQLIIVLPDISLMVAEVKINEALTGMIRPGQSATVTCDAAPDVPLTGTVESIGVLAESYGWRDPNRRDYTVRIRLDGRNALDLKPSMRCQATIRVDHVAEAVHVPIQAVHREGAATFVYVPDGAGYSQKLVTVGRASEMYIEITAGLDAGASVLLREPAAKEILVKLPPEIVNPKGKDGEDDSEQVARQDEPRPEPPPNVAPPAGMPANPSPE
jgi:HlyD family secretion protein